MYLILPTSEAEDRNRKQAEELNCTLTQKWWHSVTVGHETALFVEDGSHLSKAEKSKCVAELPAQFLKIEEE